MFFYGSGSRCGSDIQKFVNTPLSFPFLAFCTAPSEGHPLPLCLYTEHTQAIREQQKTVAVMLRNVESRNEKAWQSWEGPASPTRHSWLAGWKEKPLKPDTLLAGLGEWSLDFSESEFFSSIK